MKWISFGRRRRGTTRTTSSSRHKKSHNVRNPRRQRPSKNIADVDERRHHDVAIVATPPSSTTKLKLNRSSPSSSSSPSSLPTLVTDTSYRSRNERTPPRSSSPQPSFSWTAGYGGLDVGGSSVSSPLSRSTRASIDDDELVTCPPRLCSAAAADDASSSSRDDDDSALLLLPKLNREDHRHSGSVSLPGFDRGDSRRPLSQHNDDDPPTYATIQHFMNHRDDDDKNEDVSLIGMNEMARMALVEAQRQRPHSPTPQDNTKNVPVVRKQQRHNDMVQDALDTVTSELLLDGPATTAASSEHGLSRQGGQQRAVRRLSARSNNSATTSGTKAFRS